MLENFKIDASEIDKVNSFSNEEKVFRLKNLDYFNNTGFPNKKIEDWKFTDLKNIVSKNFNKLDIKPKKKLEAKIDFLKNFDHNYIVVVNGKLSSSNFEFEQRDKVEVKNFINENFQDKRDQNPLVCLNHALSDSGYFLKVDDNYKF
jgi:Fe-S cluster assembly protein SufD